ISEFEAVGNVMREFASEDANVVMGTVLDPELSDELRVTVVATGLGEAKREKPRPQAQAAPPAAKKESSESLDTPTYLRRQREAQQSGVDQDDLDIPAFLRKQAD
ncbi:MAG: cell division protein FtsZ, partial [Thiohalorhabdaceae bacterium]